MPTITLSERNLNIIKKLLLKEFQPGVPGEDPAVTPGQGVSPSGAPWGSAGDPTLPPAGTPGSPFGFNIKNDYNDYDYDYVVNKIIDIIPEKFEKIVIRITLGEASYSIAFWVEINGEYIKCYDLISNDNLLDSTFKNIFNNVYETYQNKNDTWTTMTIVADSNNHFKTDFDYDKHIEDNYEYDKKWKEKYLGRIKKNNVEHSQNLIDSTTLNNILKHYNLEFGPQLLNYILKYGYLASGNIEFFGIDNNQKEKSDMIIQTLNLHKYFEKTQNLIAFENLGDGNYILIDKRDKVFRFISENDDLKPLNINLNEYIINRLGKIIKI